MYNNELLPYYPVFLILSNPCCLVQVIKKLYLQGSEEGSVVEKLKSKIQTLRFLLVLRQICALVT